MDQEILEEYEKVKDKISQEDFLAKMESMKKDYADVSFVQEIDIARMVVGTFIDEKNEVISDKDENKPSKIAQLETGQSGLSIVGRIMSISNPKLFTSRKGKDGKLCNIQLADNTGSVRVVLWTENIKLLKHVSEGNIVQITNVECKDGYRGGNELHMQPRSTMKAIQEGDEAYPADYMDFPVYEEIITPIADIVPDETVNVMGRLIRVPDIRSYESNGKKGKVTSLEIQDASGKISYTLWNKDVKLIDSLDLEEGDTLKILNEQARERNGEISLSHWDGRIIKGDFDVPEFEEEIFKIAEAHEVKDIVLLGIVTKVQDTITFNRASDGKEGYVKTIELTDDTGAIRVTLWGDDTKLAISKGDILKVVGGNIEYDDYSSTGYRVNTNWNTQLVINPEKGNSELIEALKSYADELGPIPIGNVQSIEDDGEEVDILGRLITLNETRDFQRDDGSKGLVKSGDFADASGMIRISFWDEKAESPFTVGNAYQIENGRTRLGMYAVELNVGKTARLIEVPEDKVGDLPSFNELESMIYEMKKIEDLDEDDRNIRIVARILDIQEPRTFQRNDGTNGKVGNMDIGDETGSIRVAMWDDMADISYSVGDAIKIENPSVRFNNDHLELSLGGGSAILKPGESDLESIPSFEELQDILFVAKPIEALEDEDSNVRITGTFNDVRSDNILRPKCPHCNNTLEQTDDEFVCDYCGEDVEEPNYLLMVQGRLEDETGEIQVAFFSRLAEELLDMKLDEIIKIVEESGDAGALEGKVENLEGLTLELLADVSFNEYNEEIRLNPKKILSKSY